MFTRHWIVAGGLALLIHAVTFYAVFYNPVEGSQDIGSQGIEFGLGMVGELGVAVQTNAAQEEAEESEEVLEELGEEIETIESEPSVESESMVEPEVIEPEPVEVKQESPIEVEKAVSKPDSIVESEPVVEPDPIIGPKSEPKKVEKPVVKAEPKQVAPPSMANLKATTGVGNSVSSGGNSGAKVSYTTELLSILAKNKRYPRASRRRREEGVVHLSFTAHADGSVSHVIVTESSGYKRLDNAVLEMIRKSTPLPKFSDDMTETELKISLPVSFKLSDLR